MSEKSNISTPIREGVEKGGTNPRPNTARPQTLNNPDIKADIDRALEIIRSFPMLRRYGDDVEAMKEVCTILEGVKEKI